MSEQIYEERHWIFVAFMPRSLTDSWVRAPGHPIIEGIGEHIDIEREERYVGSSSGAGGNGRLGTELGQSCHTSE